MLNMVAPNVWHPLKMSICESLNTRKQQRTIEILSAHYIDVDVMYAHPFKRAYTCGGAFQFLAAAGSCRRRLLFSLTKLHATQSWVRSIDSSTRCIGL
jgi:hypothetical protein|eukprot:COSAG01_NODE_1050_length_11922_cov_8.014632_11_plen_98_part_00